MAIDFNTAFKRRDEFSETLLVMVQSHVYSEAELENVTDLAEQLLKEEWVTFDE